MMRRGWWCRSLFLLLPLLLPPQASARTAFIPPWSSPRGAPLVPSLPTATATSTSLYAEWSPSRSQPAYHPDPELPPTAEAIDAKLKYWHPRDGMSSAQAMDSLLELAYGYRAHLELDHIVTLLRRLVRETQGAPEVRQALMSSDARFGEIMDQARSQLLGPNARLGDNQKYLPRVLNLLGKLGLSFPSLAYSNGPLGGGTSSSLLRFMDAATGYLDWQVKQQNQPLTGQELSLVVHALGKMRWYGGEKGAALVQALAGQAGSGRPVFLPHGIAMVLTGLANLNHHPGGKVMGGIIRTLSPTLEHQTPQGLAMIMDSLGRLGWGQHDEEEEEGYHSFMEAVGRQVREELMREGSASSSRGGAPPADFRPKELAMVVDGLAKLRYDWEAYRGGQEVVEALGREVASRITEFSGRDLVMVVYGLGNLNYRPGQSSIVGKALVRAASSLLAWGPTQRRMQLQHLALLVYGLGKMGLRSDDLLTSVSHHLLPFLTTQQPQSPTSSSNRRRTTISPKPVDLVMVLQGLSGMMGAKVQPASTTTTTTPRLAAAPNTALSLAEAPAEQGEPVLALQALLDSVQDQLPQFKPSELLSTLDALLRLSSPSSSPPPSTRPGWFVSHLPAGQTTLPPMAIIPEAFQGLVDDLVELVVARLDRFRTRDVALMVFFLGKLGYECSHVAERLQAGLQRRLWEFEGNALSLLIWGLGRMGFGGGDSFLSSFTQVASQRLAELKPPQMVMMMEGLTRVGYIPRDDGVFLALYLAHASRDGMTDFSKDNLAYLVTDMRRLLDRQEEEQGRMTGTSPSPSRRRLQDPSQQQQQEKGGYKATVRILEAAKARLEEMDMEEVRRMRAAYDLLPARQGEGVGEGLQTSQKVLQAKMVLMQRSMDDLKQLCRAKGLRLGGRKAELVDRLIDFALMGGRMVEDKPMLASPASFPGGAAPAV